MRKVLLLMCALVLLAACGSSAERRAVDAPPTLMPWLAAAEAGTVAPSTRPVSANGR